MQSFEPYEIHHLDIDHLSEIKLPVTNCFVVCWRGPLPLAHCWIAGEEIPISLEAYIRQIQDACQPALNFYSTAPVSEALKSLPRISVVICTHNRTAALQDCILSLRQNSDTDFDLIVVDNAPADQQTKALVSRFPGVRYINEARKGLSIARNTGARAALHPIIAYLDDDVRVPRDWIRRIKTSFEDPELMAITGLVLPGELQTKSQYQFEKYWSFNRGYIPETFDYTYFLNKLPQGVPVWDIGAGANMAFRREAFELVGGFDERLGAGASGCSEDSEYWYRILATGWKCQYIPSLYAFHQHRASDDALEKQLFYYMRGHICALLVQYEKYGHTGNLTRLYKVLPTYFYRRLRNRLLHGDKQNAYHLFAEISGLAAGWFYYYFHRRDPGYSIPFFLPYAINQKAVVASDTLVSVIIPCHNLGKYLPEAIESVLNQDHVEVEVIVVDDSEAVDIRSICDRYEKVLYVRAEKKNGVSMKRNIGVQYCRGAFLVFLDADDFLYPEAISANLHYFSLYPYSAFVSGGFNRVDENREFLEQGYTPEKSTDHFLSLLQGNYIGTEGNVMYKRAVFFPFHFDTAVSRGEDYLLHLQISRYFRAYGHTRPVLAYRIHRTNVSNDRKRMLKSTLNVLKQQKKLLFCLSERKALRAGLKNWKDYYRQ